MSKLTHRVVLAALLAAAPVASFAEGRLTVVDACIQAFLASDVAKDRKVTVKATSYAVPRPIALSGLYQVEVVATGRHSGEEVARVVCDANRKGQIVAINGRPAPSASVATR